MGGVEEATQTVLGAWHRYGNDVQGLYVFVGESCFQLSRRRSGTVVVEQYGLPTNIISDDDLPEKIVRLVEGVKFPASVHINLYATRDPRDVSTNMHAEWLPAPEHVTRRTSKAWKPYLDYARRVQLVNNLHSNNNTPTSLQKHLKSYNSWWDRAALVNKNGTVIGHAVVDEPAAKEDTSLVRLFVDPNHRKRGGGGVLVRAVEKRAKGVKASGITINSSMEGQQFYRGEGYRNQGGYQFYKRARNFR